MNVRGVRAPHPPPSSSLEDFRPPSGAARGRGRKMVLHYQITSRGHELHPIHAPSPPGSNRGALVRVCFKHLGERWCQRNHPDAPIIGAACSHAAVLGIHRQHTAIEFQRNVRRRISQAKIFPGFTAYAASRRWVDRFGVNPASPQPRLLSWGEMPNIRKGDFTTRTVLQITATLQKEWLGSRYAVGHVTRAPPYFVVLKFA
jgi:hypothetical protein